jgi:hypothetical protein
MSQKSAQALVKRRYALERFLTKIAREGHSVPLDESFLFEQYASGELELEDIAREILGYESASLNQQQIMNDKHRLFCL